MPCRTRAIAHRGASHARPENTLPAFEYAIELGMDLLEFDVHLTADGYPVVIHDGSVDRTTNGTGKVSELTLNEVKSFDVADGVGIPTLEEVLELAEPSGLGLDVQLKADDENRTALTTKTIRALRKTGYDSRAFIASDEATVLLVKQLDENRPICNLGGTRDIDTLEHNAQIGSMIVQPHARLITHEYVEKAHSLEITVNVFYADDEDEMRRLIDCGVDGILTNEAELLLKVLGR